MSRDSFVGDAMSPTPYSEVMAECERLSKAFAPVIAEEAMRNREMREECERLRRDLAAAREALREAHNDLARIRDAIVSPAPALRRYAAAALAAAPATTLGDGGHTA